VLTILYVYTSVTSEFEQEQKKPAANNTRIPRKDILPSQLMKNTLGDSTWIFISSQPISSIKSIETVEILSINPLIPQSWGIFFKLGDAPRPPAGSILHLFFSGLQ
jgi:hypothetical protein